MSWKKITSIVLLLCMLMSMFSMPVSAANIDMGDTGASTDVAETGAVATNYGLVSNIQQGQILQCWNWSYNNIKANMGKIAEQGFSTIQTSPVQPIKESTTEYWSTVMNSSWVIYQPVAFNIETNYFNAAGTKAEFKSMCEEAHKYGIKVVVDVVLNHMANDMSGNTIHPWVPSDLRDNPDCWHDISKNTYNFDDRYEVTQYCMTGLPDLNTANSTVQWHCTNLLKECIEAGADGFRIDAAKHIETDWDHESFRSNFWPNVINATNSYAKSTRGITPYYYGEILGSPGGGLSIEAYTRYMSASDPGASDDIRNGVANGNASSAARGSTGNGAAKNKVVQWTESHDNHKDNGTRFMSDDVINKVWAMIGSKQEICGMYLARPSNMDTTKMGDADWTSWTHDSVRAVNQFKNHFVGQSEYLSSYYNLACVERGNSGMIIVNTGGTYYNGMSAPVHTMANGTYKDAITGNTFTVSGGWISGDIGTSGIAVVYDLDNAGTFNKGNLTEFSLVGSFNDWNKETNRMIANNGITATTTLSLAAGTYTFKLTAGDLWYGNGGTISDTTGNNPWTFTTTESANCTLKATGGRYTFTFDTSTRKLSVQRVSSSSTATSPYYLKGDFNSWGTGNAMTYVDGQNAVTTTISLDAGTYKFKINNDNYGIWYGNSGTIVDSTTSSSSTGWEMSTSAGDCTLQATTGGKFTFTFNMSTQRLIITNVSSVTATFKDYDGTVLSTQTVNIGTAPTAPANPIRTGYTFTGWSPSIGAITKDTTYTAQYSVNSYTVSASSSPAAGGTTTASATKVNHGSTVTFTAAANTANNYSFTNWQLTGAYTITSGSLASTSITIAPTSNVTAVANYTQAATYTVSTAAGTGGSAAASAAKVVEGNNVTFTATASKGYAFSSWSISGSYTIVSGTTSSTSITIKPTSNVTASASFVGNSSTVKFAAGSGGTVTNTSSATITYPNARSSTATASTGYAFSKWTINGGTLGTDYEITSGSTTTATISIRPLTSGKTITATASFVGITGTVKFAANTGGTVSNSGSNSVTYPSTKTSTATASEGYNFSKWTITGGTLNSDYKITSGSTTSQSITIQVLTAGTTITATASFTLKTYVVTFLDWNGNTLATTSVSHGNAATAPSNPTRAGYVFTGWDTDFSSVKSNITVTAQYVSDTAYLLGSFNGWDTTKGVMTSASGNIVTAKYELEAGEYTFKILHQDKWLGNWGTVEDTTVTTSSIGWEMVDGAADCTLVASGGTYIFNYNKSTKMLEIIFDAPVYTVTFLNYNGTTISTQTVAKGGSAKAPADPVRNATAQYTYTFTGWDKDFTNIQADTTVTAVFTSKLNSYTVQFVDYDGTVLKKQTVEYGSAATAPANPTRASNAQYTFTFKSWDKSFSRITGDTTVTATYTQTLNKYTVTFKNWDGSTLSTQSVEYGKAATAPATPTRDGYIFTGWDKSFANITGNITVTALFEDGRVYLLGSFNDWSTTNGLMSSSGTNVVTTTYELAAGTYTFKVLYKDIWYGNYGTIEDTTTTTSATGWEMVDGYGDCTLQATGGKYTFTFNTSTKMLVVTRTVDTYTVTFKNYNGTTISTQTVEKGKSAVAPADPTRAATAQYTYTFNGWDTDFTNVTKDLTVTALFDSKLNSYTVQFLDYDGTVLKKQTVEYGAAATAPANPSRAATAQYTYTFKSWDKSFSKITGDTTVNATYTQTVNKYTVTFKGMDGATLSTQSVEYGAAATAPSAPTVNNYTFTGWDKDFSNITGNLTVTAQYADNRVYLLGSFNGWATDTVMTTTSGNVVTTKLTLAAGTYTFKILYKDVWYGNYGTIEDTTTTTSATGWEMVDGYDDCTLAATGGNYTFNFNTSTNMLEVIYLADAFTVTFLNYDGTVLSTQTVQKGESAKAPADPTRKSNAQYTYTFAGWDTDYTNIQADTVVTAKFTQTVNKYTVTFKNYDGTVLSTQTVEYGKSATAPATPTREGNAQYTFTFAGWDTAFANITGDTVVTATFTQTAKKYTVTFVNYDGSVLKTQQVEYGKSATAPSNPTRKATAQYTYTFKGWDKTFASITADTVVTATYTQTVNKYTVTFVDWDGTVLKTQTVEYGKAATAPADPYRPEDENFEYEFSGWDKSFSKITGDLVVTAQYTTNGNLYMVVFLDDMGDLIEIQEVPYGSAAVAPEPPEREGMIFLGWDTDFSYIESETIVFAMYAEYKVYLPGSFNGWDTETEMTIEDGPVVSTTMDLEEGEYKFKIFFNDTWFGNWGTIEDTTTATSAIGWEMDEYADDCTLVASGGTYTFKYNVRTKMLFVYCDSAAASYTVTFKNYDGTVLSTQTVEKGKSAKAPADPTRNANAQYTFTFAGWDTDYTNIQADTVVTATYKQTLNKYTVTFKDYDGTVISTQQVEYGKSATAPADPTREATAQYTYTFKTWDKAFTNITSDTVVNATYTQTINVYTVTFVDFDGTVIDKQQVEYGKSATAPAAPTREGDAQYTYTFKAWDKSFANIAGDTVITATYTQTLQKYTVVFLDMNGEAIATQTVEYGKAATAPTAPTVANYVFTGWDTDFSNITENTLVTALYADNRVYIPGDFNGWTTDSALEQAAGDVVTTTLTLEAGTYTFKVLHRDVWYGNYGVIDNTTKNTSETGWEMVDGYGNCTLEATGGKYTFNFNTTTKMLEVLYASDAFTVTFKNYDGTVLKTEAVNKGSDATAPETPVRQGNAQYTYTFAGWDTEFTNIQADTVVTATYTSTINVYTVTFKNADGKVIETQAVEYGKGATAPAAPTMEADAQYTYTFKAWDTDFTSIKGDTVVTATYTETLNKYTVTFVDYDGTVLLKQTVEYGNAAAAPEAPTREANAQYTYTFKAWDTDFTSIKGDTVVKATYTETLNKYTVKFVDYNGTVLSAQAVEYGKGATAPAAPTREGNDQYTYTFKSWDKDFANITGDLTVTAIYTETLNKYTVVFVDNEGELLAEQEVEYGAAATAPVAPAKNGYVFAGWDTDFSVITGNTIVTALYNEISVFLLGDFNGWTFDDAMVSADGSVVTITMELAAGEYKFKVNMNDTWYGNWGVIEDTTLKTSEIGWEMDSEAGDCTLTATGGTYTFNFNVQTKFIEILFKAPEYTVTFKDYDGTVLGTDVVTRGEDATAPAAPTREGYDFRGWDKDITNVQADITVTAVYEEIVSEYTVTFVNYDGTVLKTEVVKRGEAATAPDAPEREANAQYTFTFSGWDKDFTNVTGNITVTALYDKTVNMYTVTFVDYDGTVITTVLVEYGKEAHAPAAPTREGYVFTGWDADFKAVSENMTITAQYQEDIVYLVGTFNDWATNTGLKATEKENIVSVTLELKEGTYEFQLLALDKWFGNGGTIEDTTLKTSEIGWEMIEGAGNCTLKAFGGTYTFNFNKETKMLEVLYTAPEYTVKFLDYNGTLLKEEKVQKGQAATAPEAPTREGYVFTGWSKSFDYITADTIVTATYLLEAITYTVTFVDYDGTVLKSEIVTAGEAATAPEAPTREGYVFVGWDKKFDSITYNLTVKAMYEDHKVYLIGSFTDWQTNTYMTETEDGKVVSIEVTLDAGTHEFKILHKDVWYGNGGTIEDTTTATSETGWEMIDGDGNCTLKATGGKYTFNFNTETKFLEVLYTPVEYTVVFKDFDGTVLSTQTVNHGAAAEAPEVPEREGYLFSKWDTEFDCVEADLVITAVYVENDTIFTVTFTDYDGTVLSTQQVAYGKAAEAPEEPTRVGYLFTGWDKKFDKITADTVVTAQYRDNAVYLYGSFNEWAEGTAMTTSEDGIAKIVLTLNKGTYYFKLQNLDFWYGNDGIIEDTTTTSSVTGWDMVVDSADCTLEASGGKYTFTFDMNTKKLVVTYVPVEYTVVFVGMDGEEISTQKVALGGKAEAPAAPEVEGYLFTGWDVEFDCIEANTIVTAQYVEDHSKFTVTFVDFDGTILDTQMVEYGEAATAPKDPERIGYIFTGWDKEFSKITGHTVITAQYKDNQIYLVGSFNEWGTDVFLTRIEDTNIFTATVVLKAGSYFFKLLQNDVWYTNASTIIDTTTVTSATGIEFKSDSAMGDTILNATGGAYTFRFNVLTNELEVLHSVVIYKVTFVDYNGTVLFEQEVYGGTSATAPTAPTREGDAQYTYTFNGWDVDFSNVQSDMTVTATYLQTLNKFTVTFVDDDGTVLKVEEVEYGKAATAPSMADKDGYAFDGWDKSFGAVTEDMVVTAKYMKGVASNVTIAGTFQGWNPTSTPFYTTSDPDKVTIKLTFAAGTHQFKIVENGSTWYGNDGTINETTGGEGWVMSNSAGDCTFVTAGGEYLFTFTISTKTLQVGLAGTDFTVEFVDWDGTVLKTETVSSGSAATAPEVPERAGYTFTGWSTDFSKVYSDLKVTATYVQGTNVHLVTFVDADGNVIGTSYAVHGKGAKSPDAPVKSGYVFTGWDKKFTSVTEDMTVTAQYAKGTASKVSIAGTFNGWNSAANPFYSTGSTNRVSVQLNLAPGTYQFKVVNGDAWYGNWGTIADTTVTTSATGWEMDATAGDCTFIASGGTYVFTYTISTNTLEVKYMGSELKVTFVDWDGTVLKTEIVDAGGSATAPNVTLTRPADNNYTYTFKGWDMDFSNVTAPLRVTAVYNANPKTFTVRFVNWNGTLLKTESVKYGYAATPPANPSRAGYIFTGWDGDINYITGNTTFTAQFADNSVYVMGDFNDWAGTPLTWVSGTTYQVKLTLAPGQYKFKIKQGNDWWGNNGWIDDTTTYTSDSGWEFSWDAGDCTLNASGSTYTFRFNTATRMLELLYVAPTYTVTFKNWDGTTLKTQYVKRGSAAYAPANPTRSGYIFTGWDADFSWISANMVITAQFALNTVSAMGDFNNWQGTGMLSVGNNVYSTTIELQAGTYKFKIKHADTWYGNNGTIENSTVATSAVGWEMVWDAGDCTLNASGGTYTFRFNTETRMLEIFYEGPVFTVTFIDWDGSIISTQQVEYGYSATAPAVPEREGFTFSGWSADFSFITGNTTIMAQYGDEAVYVRGTFNDWGLSSPMRGTETPKVYTFVVELAAGEYQFKIFTSDIWYGNGGTIEDSTIHTSEIGWEMDGSAGDCTLIAQGGTYLFRFNTETRMLEILRVEDVVTVTFVNWDGTVIEVQEVKYGAAAVAPTDLVREGYVFVGWDQEIDYVTGDITVTALYRKAVILSGSFLEEGTEMTLTESGNYEVTITIEAGKFLFEILYGGISYALNSTFGDNIDNVTLVTDADGKCTMVATGGDYKFSFNTETGVLFVEKLEATGDEPEPDAPATGDEPDAPATGDEPEPEPEDTIHEVTWNESENFTIVTDSDPANLNTGDSFSFTVNVKDGYKIDAVVYNMMILTAVNGVYTIGNIVGDTNFIVVVSKDTTVVGPMKFTVTFTDKDGNVLSTEVVKYGEAATAPVAPEIEGYNFIGWDTDYDYVTMDITVKATYKKIAAPVTPATTGTLVIELSGGTNFTMTVSGGNTRPQGGYYYNKKMPIGATVTVVAKTTDGAEFIGWMNEAGVIVSKTDTYTFVTSGNDYLKAVYKTQVQGVNLVIFKNSKASSGNGQNFDMQYYAAGDKIVFPNDPSQSGYDFVGWSMTEAEIQAELAKGNDVTVTAVWKLAKVYVTITVNGGAVTSGSLTDGKGLAYNAYTVTADAAAAGKKFAYWMNAEGQVVSYNATYKFYPATDTELTAIYVAEDENIVKNPIVSIAGDPTVEGTKIAYTISWEVDETLGKITNYGILFVNANDYNEDTFYHNSGDNKMFDRAVSVTGNTATKSLTLSQNQGIAYDNVYVAMAFVVYTDAETGQSVTVYSALTEVYKQAP